MSEFNFGKCAECHPLQALLGALLLERADVADEQARLDSAEIFKFYCEAFTRRSRDEQIVFGINGQPCGSAEQYALVMIKHLRASCATRLAINTYDVVSTQNIVSFCEGPMSAEIKLPNEPLQTVTSCRCLRQIEAFMFRFSL